MTVVRLCTMQRGQAVPTSACLLLRAGAEVNARDSRFLIVFLASRRRWKRRSRSVKMSVFPILLRAGATLPDLRADWGLYEGDRASGKMVYERVRDEGGFANLARLHLNKLTETFAPKFAGRGLPPEIVRHVVSFLVTRWLLR